MVMRYDSLWSRPLVALVLVLLLVASIFMHPIPAVGAGHEAGCRLLATPEDAVAQALRGNPGLKGVEARFRAAREAVVQASALPDPVVSFNLLNLPTDTFDLDQEAMTQLQVKLSQAVPFPGKLSLKGSVARLQAAALEEEVRGARLRLAGKVKGAWWRLAADRAILRELKEGEGLLRQALDVAMVKYRVGKGLQQDVLLAQVELGRLRDRERSIQGAMEGERARLTALLGLSGSACVEVELPKSPSLPRVKAREELLREARDGNPAVAAAARRREAAAKALELARKGLLPDFKLGAAYGFRQGRDPMGRERPDFATFTLSMTIPLWARSRQLPAIREKGAQEARARAVEDDVRNRVEGAVVRLLQRYRSIRDQADLYRQRIIPAALQTARSMMAAYRVDKVDFLNLVRAELALINYRVQLWNLYARGRGTLAALEAEVGGPVLE